MPPPFLVEGQSPHLADAGPVMVVYLHTKQRDRLVCGLGQLAGLILDSLPRTLLASHSGYGL